MNLDLRNLTKDITYKKEEIDCFFDENESNWAYFDKETGYLLKSSIKRDGMDGSSTVSTYKKNGERTLVNYKDKKCRINTYGNSFTQCHQVSDAETWQEALAAHFAEPIRNYGIGGFGVYQAYLRMLRHENDKETKAPYVILNIFPDDHYRSIDKWRWIRIKEFREEIRKVDKNYFHANPWNYLRYDKEKNDFVENESIAPSKEDLYKLCDSEYVYDKMKDDLIVHINLALQGKEFDREIVKRACIDFEVNYDFETDEKTIKTIKTLYDKYAISSTIYVIKKAKRLLEKKNQKLLVVLSYSIQEIVEYCEKGTRFDNLLIDYLESNNLEYADMLKIHKKDFEDYSVSPIDYAKRFFVAGFGHYNPIGNMFFAFGIKDKILSWLDEKPITYNDDAKKDLAHLMSYLA